MRRLQGPLDWEELGGTQELTMSSQSLAAQAAGVLSRRSTLETYVDILRAVDQEKKIVPTHVMYRSNLSWSMCRDRVAQLVRRGMIREEQLLCEREGSGAYEPLPSATRETRKIRKRVFLSLTERGRIWLESYELLMDELFSEAVLPVKEEQEAGFSY